VGTGVDDQPAKPGTPDFYREQAKDMLRRAEEATSAEARASFLGLAEHWHRLAQQAENPSW
jgi:hypothetical protein